MITARHPWQDRRAPIISLAQQQQQFRESIKYINSIAGNRLTAAQLGKTLVRLHAISPLAQSAHTQLYNPCAGRGGGAPR